MTATDTELPGWQLAGLDRLISPRSIAVVGATDRSGSYAAETLINLRKLGFAGEIWGVNPGRSEVFGYECVPTVADLPEAVDAVVVAIPAQSVPEVIEQCGVRGCGGAVVFSAGFAEVPTGEGLQAQLVAAAERLVLLVCGPKCNGIVSPHSRTALWGDALNEIEPGALVLISQSGNVAVNALAARRGLRFHTVIASGNQAVLSASDYLAHFATQEGVGAAALYLEDDGGPGLCDGLAACADAGLPVVVLKVGSSAAGARAAASHSGALAGDQRVFRSLVADAGAVWAADLHELLELSKTLAVPRRRSRASVGGRGAHRQGVAIMTCSGGDSAQGADEAHAIGLELPELATDTCARLAKRLPPAATAANPLDYTAMIWGDTQALAGLIAVVGSDPAVGQVLVFYDQPPGLDGAAELSWGAVRDGIVAGAGLSPVPTMVSSTLPELLDDAAAWRFASAGVPAVAGLRSGVRCTAALLEKDARDAEPERGRQGDRLRAIASVARSQPPRVASSSSRWLAEHEGKQLLRAAGIAVTAGRVARDADDAVALWRELDGPVVLKLSAASVQHKSDLGGVILGLDSEPVVRDAFVRLNQLAERHDGVVLVEQMLGPGLEVIVAASREGLVPALIIGLGGIWTELLDDVAVVPLPADRRRVERALRTLRGAAMLHGGYGGRGGGTLDVAALSKLAEQVGAMLLEHRPQLVEIECNPVIVGPPGQGAIAADAAIAVVAADESED